MMGLFESVCVWCGMSGGSALRAASLIMLCITLLNLPLGVLQCLVVECLPSSVLACNKGAAGLFSTLKHQLADEKPDAVAYYVLLLCDRFLNCVFGL